MENTIFTQAAKFVRERRYDRRWKTAVICLAVIVICGTAWILSKKGQALAHSGDLACPLVVHAHTAECYDENDNLICGEADYVIHTHHDDCYDAKGKLVCKLPEVKKHEHSAKCFETEEILICGYDDEDAGSEMLPSDEEKQADKKTTDKDPGSTADSVKELICEKAEHTHDDSCYGEAKPTCGLQAEEGHSHDDSCYTTEKTLICKESGESHTHSSNCYGNASLICGLQAEKGHSHDDGCYKEERTLTCDEEENEDHTHGDGCYTTEKTLTCGKEETAGHFHNDSCYGEAPLICGQEEKAHIHDDGCYITEKTLTCDEEEAAGHTHDDSCYGEAELSCGQEIHKHDESCYRVENSNDNQDEAGADQNSGTEIGTDEAAADEPGTDKNVHIHTDDCYQVVRKFVVCGEKGAHIHADDCYDADGSLICEVPYVESVEEHVHAEDCFEIDDREYTQTFRNGQIEVTAVYKKSAGISEEARLYAEQITKASDAQYYEERLKALEDALGALSDEETLAMLLQIGFKTDDERFAPEDTVRLTVRFLDDSICTAENVAKVANFEEDDVRQLIPANNIEIDDEGAITFEVRELSELAFITTDEEDSKAHILTYEDEDYIMTITLGAGTEIPEDAELTVDRITKQNSPEQYEERLAQLGGEDIAMLLSVWISADGMDTGLREKASVKVQFLNDDIYSEGDAVKAACFEGDDCSRISGTDIDEERSTTFVVEELSELALIVPAQKHILTYEGDDYIVTVDLREGTGIPKEARLMVEQITVESGKEYYEGRLAQLKETEGMLAKEEGIALLLHMWISVDGEEIGLNETADITVQFLDTGLYFEDDVVKAVHFTGEGTEKHVELLYASDIDETLSTTFEADELNDFAFIMDDVRIMTYEGEDFIVTVRFHETAKIPEKAELIAERITEESDPEGFAECRDAMQEQVEEKYVIMDALMDIGFYVDGKEIEPQDTVEVKIQLLDREELESEENGSRKVAHFAEDGVEILEDAEIFEDNGNSLSATFQTDSFSLYAVGRGINWVEDAQQFHYAMESAQDGDVIQLGANIVFEPETYNAETGTFDAPYAGWARGERGNLLIAQLSAWNGRKTITLDLNGYTIRLNGNNMTLVDIYGGYCEGYDEGGSPNINYDARNVELIVTDSQKDLPRSEGYSTSYAITTSRVIDERSGKTAETTEERQITGGAIVGTGGGAAHMDGQNEYVNNEGNRAAVFTMYFGTLTIESGIIAENGNRAVQSRGGNINLRGGYLLNNSAKDTYGDGEGWFGDYGYALGGAVMCENGSVDGFMKGCEIILTGTILSGNKAVQGGAINVSNASLIIRGGFITHNAAMYGQWGFGGGGIQLHSAYLLMEGGQITANHTRGGGGGICATRLSSVFLKGGYIAANSTEDDARGEGGGVALYEEWVDLGDGYRWYSPQAWIGAPDEQNKIYITNNKSNTTIDWGGGGLFVSEGATAYLYNALITDNRAEGFGGGLAACATGRIFDFNDKGAAIYGNSAAGDAYAGSDSDKHADQEYTADNPAFWERDENGKYLFQDYFSALYSYLDSKMLGGGNENWDGSIDKERIEKGLDNWTSSYVAGLTAYPSSGDIWNAQQLARVFITGNTSKTHGGGIMCNGVVLIGVAPGEIENSTALKLEATKVLVYDDKPDECLSMEKGQFSFTVYEDEACTESVAAGTSDEKGLITFNKLFSFDLKRDCPAGGTWKPNVTQEGDRYQYTYYIKEDAELPNKPENIGVEPDRTVYRLTVTVEKTLREELDGGIKRYADEIKRIDVKKIDTSGQWVDINLPGNGVVSYEPVNDLGYLIETHPITVSLTTNPTIKGKNNLPTFTNTKTRAAKITVEKKWSDGSKPQNASVTVRLIQTVPELNNKLISSSEIVLSDTNGWSYTWDNLAKEYSEDGKAYSFHYEVEEIGVTGQIDSANVDVHDYVIEYESATDTAGNPVVAIINTPKTFDFELTKKGENGEDGVLLSGVKFQILDKTGKNPLSFRQVTGGYEYIPDTEIDAEKENGSRVSQDLYTDEKAGEDQGKLIVSGLPAGTYILREVDAPIGYKQASDHTITFGVTESKVQCTEKTKSDNHECEYRDDPDNHILYFILTDDEDKYALPKTGGCGANDINILGLCVIFGMSALIYMTCRRRKGDVSR